MMRDAHSLIWGCLFQTLISSSSSSHFESNSKTVFCISARVSKADLHVQGIPSYSLNLFTPKPEVKGSYFVLRQSEGKDKTFVLWDAQSAKNLLKTLVGEKLSSNEEAGEK